VSEQLTTARPVPATAEPVAETRTAGRDLAGTVCIVLAVLAVLVLVGSFIWSSNRGLDLTDEGFHLNTLRHASVAPQGGSQFGSVVRIITFGHVLSVAGYRLLGFVLLELAAAASAFAFVSFTRRRQPTYVSGLLPTAAVVATVMLGAALGYSWLPRTVSYLVLTPALLCVIAALCLVLMARTDRGYRLDFGDIITAVAWGCAGSSLFYTKFSSAAAALVLGVLALLLTVSFRRTVVSTAIIGGSFVALTLALNATSWFSIHQLTNSASALGSGSHSSSALRKAYVDEFTRLSKPTIEAAVMLSLVLIGALLAVRLRKPLGALVGIVCVVVGLAGFVHALGRGRAPWDLSPIVVFAAFGAFVVLLAVELFLDRARWERPLDEDDADRPGGDERERRSWLQNEPTRRAAFEWIALTILFLGLPFAGALGSNTGLISVALSSGALLALGMLTLFAQWRALLPPEARRNMVTAIPIIVALGCFAFVIERSVARDLYRVPVAASRQTESVPGVKPLAGLRVDPGTRDLVEQTVADANKAGPLRPGTPIITAANLEGLAYALDGYVAGSGWIDPSTTTCVRLGNARQQLAKAPIILRGAQISNALDSCFRKTVPGYPNGFQTVGTITLDSAWRRQLGFRQILVLQRR
jgi:hypothetical protein